MTIVLAASLLAPAIIMAYNEHMVMLFNIVTAVVSLGAVFQWMCRKWTARKFRKVFGDDVRDEFHVVQNWLSGVDPSSGRLNKFYKPSRADGTGAGIGQNLEWITSCASATAAEHLINTIGQNVKKTPTISSDISLDTKMNISFISIGGNNYKTNDLLGDSSNMFLRFVHENNNNHIKNVLTEKVLVDFAKQNKPGHDYGIIVKIHPQANLNRTWFCCAGFGTSGTSGAAYYLASKWQEIVKWADDTPFACVTRTRINSDESTEIMEAFVGKSNWFSRLIRKIRCRNISYEITEQSQTIRPDMTVKEHN